MEFKPIESVVVVGITGHARHGKDTFAKMLIAEVPGAERFAFSDAVAAHARATGEMDARDPRVLQIVGNRERERDPDVWLRCLYRSIEDRMPRLAVVTGVRFPNEVEMIRAMGGSVIKIERALDASHASRFVATDRDMAGPTERQIDTIAVDQVFVAHDLHALAAHANQFRVLLTDWLLEARPCRWCLFWRRGAQEAGTCWRHQFPVNHGSSCRDWVARVEVAPGTPIPA